MMSSEEKHSVLLITLTKSPIGYSYRQKRTVRALGLRRMHQTVEQPDTLVIRGMVDKVKHLVTVEEAD
jgi:large subunit ribosomal protein L30